MNHTFVWQTTPRLLHVVFTILVVLLNVNSVVSIIRVVLLVNININFCIHDKRTIQYLGCQTLAQISEDKNCNTWSGLHWQVSNAQAHICAFIHFFFSSTTHLLGVFCYYKWPSPWIANWREQGASVNSSAFAIAPGRTLYVTHR